MVSRWDKYRVHKNEQRRIKHRLPLERPILNAIRRARTSWQSGMYATPQAVSAISVMGLPRNIPCGAPITFYCPLRLTKANGFVIRWVQSSKKGNPSFVAIFDAQNVIACPVLYVSQGHVQTLTLPPPLPLCAYCTSVVFVEQECSTCGAPQFSV